jgi:hypothetical protein
MRGYKALDSEWYRIEEVKFDSSTGKEAPTGKIWVQTRRFPEDPEEQRQVALHYKYSHKPYLFFSPTGAGIWFVYELLSH